ncbi:hypothetical protein ASPWEDRAFT_184210 [Aspergillus wentii DTO 134E9]|uniref:DUF6604 domain-containing protein n=1 Tax=Aspergillus wentii DTO 134E9 TaxID=1073089 RepID=A0A1L9RFB5_ASPWE|nr:uncharacterized protein ASPWEDRAFT_184210 [Aspergillus wentii DTO 134E9]OJJ33621.1 hypothetical protein ASPWEDRAFT_184210 [Aspergillus wentii DTO 134E9]
MTPERLGVLFLRERSIRSRDLCSLVDFGKDNPIVNSEIVASNPDPDIERSNNSYEHWINRLTQAFNALGGESWLLEQRDTLDVSDEDEEEVIFATKSSTLSLGVSSGESQEDEEEGDDDKEEATVSTAARSKKKPAKKGEKGRRPG